MILSDIARVIDGSPPGLQGSTIVDERLLTLPSSVCCSACRRPSFVGLWPAVICRQCVLGMKTVSAFARSNGA
jgi:hypothetical protein